MAPAERLLTVDPMPAIEVDDLFKSYGSVNAVRGVSFRVDDGEVFALLGPNGAGKSTTLEILEGHRRRSGGRVAVLGIDPETGARALRERIGIVLQSAGIDAELSVREALALYGSCYPRSLAVSDAVAIVGLADKTEARVKSLSGGQRRRLDLALALIGDPDVIFLDEFTTGFDPAARRGAWEIVKRLRGLGRTIVLTSHYMDEVQHLADRVVVMADGQIVAEGAPQALGDPAATQTVISFRMPDLQAMPLPTALLTLAVLDGDRVTIRSESPTRVLRDLCNWAVAADIELEGLQATRPSLEDVYLRLTEDGDGGDR